MNLKNALNKMGLVEDEIPTSKPAPKQQVAPQQTTYAPPVTAPVSFAPSTIDPTIQQMLAQSLQDNKLSGFDYLKFTSSVEETKAFGVPEDARYKMAFSTAKQLGVDKANLLKSGEHYLDVLAQDESSFNADCAQFEKAEVKSREARLTQISNTVGDLTTQLAKLQQDQVTLAQELQDEKSKLDSRRTAFQVTLQSFRDTIQSNIQKINQYLQ